MSLPDVAVIGGGVVGAACARALAARDLSVLLLDSGQESGIATSAAAGMLAPLAETRHEDPMLSLSILARDFYGELVPELEERTGIDIGLWSNGILKVAFEENEAHRLRNEIGWQRQQGFNSDWLSVDEVRAKVPGIGEEVLGALFAPEDGALNPIPLLEALLADVSARGGTIRHGVRIDGIATVGDEVTGVRADGDTTPVGAVIVAAGCWSGQIAGLPRPLSIEPIRGQIAALDWPTDEPPSIVYGGQGYVVCREGEALVGSTMEHVRFDASTTDAGVARILSKATRIFPSLKDVVPKRCWAGLRPVSPDGRPIVGPDPGTAGLWYATGHARNGILLAGLTGQLIARMFVGEEMEHDLSGMDPGRFWRF